MISIVIPTRNEARVLAETLHMLEQGLTHIPHEIIVSDGSSTDGTADIARASGARVLTEDTAVPHTIARGRNLGAAQARGEMLLFLDADVRLLHPGAFVTMALNLFDADPALVALTGRLRVFPDRETRADRVCFGMVNVFYSLINNVLPIGGGAGKFHMVPRAAFARVKGYDESLVVGEDDDLFRRLRRIGRTRYEPKLTVYHGGRRAHALGWPRLMTIWFFNACSVLLLHRSYDKEWKPVR